MVSDAPTKEYPIYAIMFCTGIHDMPSYLKYIQYPVAGGTHPRNALLKWAPSSFSSNCPSNPCVRPQSMTKVENPVIGTDKSGALMSFRGALNLISHCLFVSTPLVQCL